MLCIGVLMIILQRNYTIYSRGNECGGAKYFLLPVGGTTENNGEALLSRKLIGFG